MGGWNRRRVLQAALAGSGATLWPGHGLFAQGSSAPLLRARKEALVIGNSRYQHSPLKNPVNDARGMAGELKKAGFSVTLGLEMTQAEIRGAIRAYGENLARSKSVGLFYFAGHGAQLAWRNYLIPVDAEIGDIQELRERGVDVNSLIESIRKAGNPINLIILDACRDNPFGSIARVDQKGLSQLDAPVGTFLAYATAPGNTAIDGEGDNGLYTEHLLKEMRVPEAKVEDVFKRVRLAVRRRSRGLQIPWESTSLEEDFWFIPPREIKVLSEKEKDEQFDTELALWEKIRDKKDAAPLEDFLRRFPSGPFSELAQHQLDFVLATQGEKKVRIAAQDGNPFTQGSVEANTKWKLEDSYTYRHFDQLSNVERKPTVHTVAEITMNEVRYRSGLVTDPLGNVLRRPGGRIYSPNQLEPLDYVVGKQWVTQFRIMTPKGRSGLNEMELRIVAREKVTVPAGTFNAFRIEGRGVFEDDERKVEVTNLTKWVAPDQVRREIIMEEIRERTGGGKGRAGKRGAGRRAGRVGSKVVRSDRWELMSFKQS